MKSKVIQDKGHQAFRILQFVFVVAPIIAGLDKFFYILADWSAFLSPFVMQIIQGHSRGFMMIVGAIEILVGIGMIFKPKVFAYTVSVWLLIIIINHLIAGRFLDIALRDFGLMLSAFALGKLSEKYENHQVE